MNILDTNIEKLKQDQLKALQEQMKKVFDDIYDLFEKGKYQEIKINISNTALQEIALDVRMTI